MKYNNWNHYLKIVGNLFACMVIVSIFFACSNDDIFVSKADEGRYSVNSEAIGYLYSGEGKVAFDNVELKKERTESFILQTSKPVSGEFAGVLVYDKSVLDAYNNETENKFEAFPENLVEISGGGTLRLADGTNQSNRLQVTYKTDDVLQPDKTYVLPLSIKKTIGNVVLGEKSTYLLFVKDLSKTADASKGENAIKVLSCMEVNDTNPLTNLCFTLKNSGKPVIDIVTIFAANIKYDIKAEKVYLLYNENIKHLLAHRDKYIKPLQDRGMKVILGVLGDHDPAGLANMDVAVAREFAKELNNACIAYGLDGIFFDDEYSNYEYTPMPPGLGKNDPAKALRLLYETRKVMPDKLVCVYVWGDFYYNMTTIEGKSPGELADYFLEDYNRPGIDLAGMYPGSSSKQWGTYSQEFRQGTFRYDETLKGIMDEGNGVHMIFGMNLFDGNPEYQVESMKRIANIFYNDELVYDGNPIPKDW